ncbi:MAG: hypothetical protein D6812_06060, partial [Deltaproteobacteria bacterium]
MFVQRIVTPRFSQPVVVFAVLTTFLLSPLAPIGIVRASEGVPERILLVNAAIHRTVSPVDRIRILSALERHLQEVRGLEVVQPAQEAKTTSLINRIYRAGSIEEALPAVKKLGAAMGVSHALIVSIEPVLEEMELRGLRLQSSYMAVSTGKVTVNEPISFARSLDDLSGKLATLPLPVGDSPEAEDSDILSLLGEDIEEEGPIGPIEPEGEGVPAAAASASGTAAGVEEAPSAVPASPGEGGAEGGGEGPDSGEATPPALSREVPVPPSS